MAKIRETLLCGQKGAGDCLGIATGTCASIEAGRKRFTPALVERVSHATGITVESIMAESENLIMVTGEEFTKDNYQRYLAGRDSFMLALPESKKRGNESFRLYLLLCIKLGRVMLAAASDHDGKVCGWKIRDELFKIGRNYSAFESRNVVAGIIKDKSGPQPFESGLQNLLNTGTPPETIWQNILARFHKELSSIETKHAHQTAKAKSPRR